MAKQRDRIRMTDGEIRDFIESRKSLQVATLNRDGSPHLTTLWFAVVDGQIVFETYTRSQKIRNLERDPRIAVLLEAGEEYAELRGVSINGRARLHQDPDEVHAYALRVMARNNPGVPEEQLDALTRRMAQKRTAVVVLPLRVMSWDHRKLAAPA